MADDLTRKVDSLLAKKKPGSKAKRKTAKTKGKGKAVKKKAKPARKKRASRPARNKMAENKLPTRAEISAEKFAHAYVRLGCNATAAYRECKPDVTEQTAMANGSRMLRKAKVQAVLFPLLEGLLEKHEVDAAWVLERWYEQATASPLDYFAITENGNLGDLDLSKITEAQRRNLRSIKRTRNTVTDKQGNTVETDTVEVRVVDQQKASEMFARYLNMLKGQLQPEDLRQIGDLIDQGVRRIRQLGRVDSKTIEGSFSEIG